MAKIITDHVIVAVSKIGRDSDDSEQTFVSAEVRAAIEAVVAELIGADFVVEVQ